MTDIEDPVIVGCPDDVYACGLGGQEGVPVYWPVPRTSDNSGSTVSLNVSPFGPGTVFGYGSHQVTYTATDPSGNTATGCSFLVRVEVATGKILDFVNLSCHTLF